MDLPSRGGCQGCLALVSAILGVLASAISILTYFYEDSNTLFEALGQFTPRLAGFLNVLSQSAENFASAWPLGPFLSALLVFVVMLVLRFIAETVFDMCTIDITFSDILIQIVVFSPLIALWILLFAEVASTLGIIAFIVGYFLSIIGSTFIISEYGP